MDKAKIESIVKSLNSRKTINSQNEIIKKCEERRHSQKLVRANTEGIMIKCVASAKSENIMMNDGDLMQFRECLIRSLLRAFLHRVSNIESEIPREIGYRLLLRQLLSMSGLRTDTTESVVDQVSKM